MKPIVMTDGNMVGRSVAELRSEFAALAAKRATLDRCIQETVLKAQPEHPADDQTGLDQPTAGNSVLEVPADSMWLELEDVLNQQGEIISTLVKTSAATTAELRAKAQILAALLQATNPAEIECARQLSISVVSDITTLFG